MFLRAKPFRKILPKRGPPKGFCLGKRRNRQNLPRVHGRSRTESSGLSTFLLLLMLALLTRLLPPPCQQSRRHPFTTRDGSSVDHVRSHDVHAMSS